MCGGGGVVDDPPLMSQPMGEMMNLGGAKEGLGKMGEKEKERWWTIGRDSKDEKKEKKKGKGKENFKMSPSLQHVCSFLLVFRLVADDVFSLQLWNICMKLKQHVQFGRGVSFSSLIVVPMLICCVLKLQTL